MQMRLGAVVFSSVVYLLLAACNKNSLELPPIDVPVTTLSLPGKLNGLSTVQFVFRQVKTGSSDSVWLTVRNNTQKELINLSLLAELCNASAQTFDNCTLQFDSTLAILGAGKESRTLITWINQHIQLDSGLINVGIISVSGQTNSPANGIYSSSYAGFRNKEKQISYYGNIRGYVLADGTATFRIKSSLNEYYNANGLFTGLMAFTGTLQDGKNIISPFSLDTLQAGASNVFVDTTNHHLNFIMKLQTPVHDTITSIIANTLKK